MVIFGRFFLHPMRAGENQVRQSHENMIEIIMRLSVQIWELVSNFMKASTIFKFGFLPSTRKTKNVKYIVHSTVLLVYRPSIKYLSHDIIPLNIGIR
jgi:hypothetical protein